MKRVFIVFLLAFASQSLSAQKLSVGIIGGYNRSNLTGENFFAKERDYTEEDRKGFHLGVVLDIPLSEKFGLQPSLSYSTKGNKHTYTDYVRGVSSFSFAKNTKGELKASYLDLPILFYFQPIKEIPIKLAMGPQVSFGLSGEYVYDGTITAYTYGDATFVANYKPKTLDLGIKAGVFGQLDRFLVGVFYQKGLTDYANGEVTPEWPGVSQEFLNEYYPNKTKHDVFQVTLGYMLFQK